MASEEAEQTIKKVTRCGDDYYAILGISKGSSDDEIKKAYRKLALRLHPDKCSLPGAEEAFKKVSEAFQVLSDSDKRSIYDDHGIDGLKGGGGRGGSGGIDPEDIFQAFFGAHGGGGGFPQGTFVQRGGMGGGGGFQTFTFSTGGPGMGGIHFSGGSPFGGGGGGSGIRTRASARRRQEQAEEEEETTERQELPSWLKGLQVFAGGLGPLLPLVIMAFFGVAMLMMGWFLQFFMSRAFILLPIMYLSEGRTRAILIGTVVVLGAFGIM